MLSIIYNSASERLTHISTYRFFFRINTHIRLEQKQQPEKHDGSGPVS